MFNIGILGCGKIAAKMAQAIGKTEGCQVAGVASRERSRAKKFAAAYCPDAKVYTGYEKLAAAKDLDLIYIATPNSYHYEHAILCIKEYKNVLIEKPFAMNADEAKSIFGEAKNRNLFVCEAMWTSFMPLHLKMLEWIKEGKIGQVKFITGDLGYDLTEVARLNDPVLGGGAYLDLGVYPTNLAISVIGTDIRATHVYAKRLSTGCDKDTFYNLESGDGSIIADFFVTMSADTAKDGSIVGEEGKIKIGNINTYRKITLLDKNDQVIEEIEADKSTDDSYIYEIEGCKKAIEAGLIQCPEMSWDKTFKLCQINDSVRASINQFM
ncbi:MAG: Gfo/Idh/MocA family oxidoreductase [Saccharofermentans sp.]|nr:Gfo/Idh/MocA family oxidoreductase [Saccharofermentans sp.]